MFIIANNTKTVEKIKYILKTHPFTKNLMKDYNISPEDVDNNLSFKIEELDGRFAEGNGKEIILDPKLFENSDFFKDNFHFVIHEFYHWIKRRSEEKFYFNDPEEVQSFVLAIAWELIDGKDVNTIYKKIYPIVKVHFQNKSESKEVFKNMLIWAKVLAKNFDCDKKEVK